MRTDASPSHKHVSFLHFVACSVVIFLLCLTLISIVWHNQEKKPWKGFQIPDENKAGQILLAQKLSGPRYFEVESTGEIPFPLMTRSQVNRQIDHVLSERHGDSTDKAKLEKLLDLLIESPQSRMDSDEQINVLRLNMALDEMK